MPLRLPEPSLVVLCGPAASGKSSFAQRWFSPTEVVSSDAVRGLLCDDPDNQDINEETFALVHQLCEARLAHGRITVVDATNLEKEGRAEFRRIARSARLPVHLVVFDAKLETLRERNKARARQVPDSVLRTHRELADRLTSDLDDERYDGVHHLDASNLDEVIVEREPLAPLRLDVSGPFDIIGDVHGCLAELETLLDQLGYVDGLHPEGRRLVFLGDLVDRGPSSVGVLRLVLPWLEDSRALFVPGNHDDKLWRWLQGRGVTVSGGLGSTVAEWNALTDAEDRELRARFDRLMKSAPPYLWLDGGALIVTHAGLEERDHGRVGPKVRAFCLYGKTTGREIDGYPERLDWAADYSGEPAVVHGHVPVRRAEWRHNTADIDLGAVFGGALCAMRWPERTFESVQASRSWVEGVARWETWTS